MSCSLYIFHKIPQNNQDYTNHYVVWGLLWYFHIFFKCYLKGSVHLDASIVHVMHVPISWILLGTQSLKIRNNQ